jgi:putative transposase
MAAHAAHELFVHLNWHVKDNRPILKGDIELMVHRAVTDRCKNLKGAKLHAINGTEDHIQLVIEYEPFVSISKLVGDIKGGSSFEANKRLGRKLLYWQRGYGANSFGRKQLPWIMHYVARQKEHHAMGTTHDRLERTALDVPKGKAKAG